MKYSEWLNKMDLDDDIEYDKCHVKDLVEHTWDVAMVGVPVQPTGLFERDGVACLGVYYKGKIIRNEIRCIINARFEPFNYDKLGKPWDEV